jgi:hypothetical protein
MATENNTKSVFINGEKDLFVSKGAIKRFKDNLKNLDLEKLDKHNIVVEDNKYLKEGYVFNINFKNNSFNANIITLEEHTINERKRLLKNKLKNAQRGRSMQVKKEMESLKRSIPKKLFQSYTNLMKQFNFSDVPSPKDVINNPEQFKKQISMIMGQMGMVSNDNNANNAIKKYFNTLGNFMGFEPSEININQNNQPRVQELNNIVDTESEGEEEPELIELS